MRAYPGLPAGPGQRSADQALPPDAPRSPYRSRRDDRVLGHCEVYRRRGLPGTLRVPAPPADVTMSIGGYMLRTWVARGGLRRQRATGVGVPPGVVFGHASAALTGLAVWISYLSSDW